MSSKYALQIRKSDLPLITLLNDGMTPLIEKKKTYFVFEVGEKGESISTTIVSDRELGQNYEIAGNCPLLLRLKK